MIGCERCGEILQTNKIDKILADRKLAIKRMNERNNNAIKKS